MSDELLPFYQKELSFIRRMGAEFAERHPEAAAALRLGPDTCEDPHVERLIMAFAYLAARIRHKLDDEFPEIAGAFLETLYPHYLAPVPSTAIVQFLLDRQQAALVGGYRIDQGGTVETEPAGGEPCRFRTVYPVTIWPIEVSAARLTSLPGSNEPGAVAAALHLELRCFTKDMPVAQLKLPALRFYLNGQSQHVFALYELILNNTLDITVVPEGPGAPPLHLGKERLRPVGFERDEGLLPYSPRSFPGYRLLSEYFTFPQKFCFFEIEGLEPEVLRRAGKRLEITLHLGRGSADLERHVSADTFRLGCTPMVNLFPQRAEPISLTHAESEYRVVPDARRPAATEVYTVDRVTAISPSGETSEFQPFFSARHAARREKEHPYWYCVRRPSRKSHGEPDHGTEVFLTLVDLNMGPAPADGWTVDVETTCLNRDLPRRLPFGGGQPKLQLADGGPLQGILCLTPPTPTLRMPPRKGHLWRLVSHLSLNHLSLSGGEGPEALREILKLYDPADSAETRSKISGILDMSSRPAVSRLRGDSLGEFCRGMEVSLRFDEERFSDSSLFLFASVLERFLGLYSTVNSFTQLLVSTQQRKGILRRWPPRAGERVLI